MKSRRPVLLSIEELGFLRVLRDRGHADVGPEGEGMRQRLRRLGLVVFERRFGIGWVVSEAGISQLEAANAKGHP